MTFLEKAAEKYPTSDINNIVEGMCPQDMELEKSSPCKDYRAACAAMSQQGACLDCWNREWTE